MKIGGNLPADAATGTTIDAASTCTTASAPSVPLRAEFTKVAERRRQVNWTGARRTTAANNVDRGPDRGDVRPHRRAHDAATSRVTQAQLNTIAGTTGTWAAGGITLDFGTATDPDRLTGAAGAEQRGRAVAGRFGDRFGRRLQRVAARPDHRRVLERPHPGARPDRARRRSPTRPVCTRRAARCSPTSVNSGAAADRRRGPGRPRHARRAARSRCRTSTSGRVHQPDRRPAWLPGELQGHHDLRRDPPGPREPEAVIA